MSELYERHADLYDLAFDWDSSEEAAWLQVRLGPACRKVLEPGCGSGRIVEALANRGLHVVGLDRSRPMVEIARRRMKAAGVDAELVVADMTEFDLDRRFDGAVCSINTLAHLSPGDLVRHLEQMGRHLPAGARYLVQLDLHDPAHVEAPPRASQWEMERGETKLRITWATDEVDVDAARQRQRSRIEILSGERAGEVAEEIHVMTVWTPETWTAALAGSPFALTAVYDGETEAHPRAEPGAIGRMLWHQLMRK
jgi:SAM-dependent methyltransferase